MMMAFPDAIGPRGRQRQSDLYSFLPGFYYSRPISEGGVADFRFLYKSLVIIKSLGFWNLMPKTWCLYSVRTMAAIKTEDFRPWACILFFRYCYYYPSTSCLCELMRQHEIMIDQRTFQGLRTIISDALNVFASWSESGFRLLR